MNDRSFVSEPKLTAVEPKPTIDDGCAAIACVEIQMSPPWTIGTERETMADQQAGWHEYQREAEV